MSARVHDKICYNLNRRQILASTIHSTVLKLRVCIKQLMFVVLNQNICCGQSKEPSQYDDSFEHTKPNVETDGKPHMEIKRKLENFEKKNQFL